MRWRTLLTGVTGGTTRGPWTAATTAGIQSTQSSRRTPKTFSPSVPAYQSSRSSRGRRRTWGGSCVKAQERALRSPRTLSGGCPPWCAERSFESPERRSGSVSCTADAPGSRYKARSGWCSVGHWLTIASRPPWRPYLCITWTLESYCARGSQPGVGLPSRLDAFSAGWWTLASRCASTSTRRSVWARA